MAAFGESSDNALMMAKLSTQQLQMGAGVLTWGAVCGLTIYLLLRSGETAAALVTPFAGIAVVNLVAMLVTTSGERAPNPLAYIALWVQLATVFAMGWLVHVDFLPIFSIIWIAIAVSFFSFGTCWMLLIAVTIGWYLTMSIGWESSGAFLSTSLYSTFHVFALLSAHTAGKAERARERVEALNRELLATQHLLSEASRQSERTRIARNLHDLLGHHLTALSINLQIAERVSEGEARERVEESHALARLLLADVREAVSTLRSESAVDFAGSLSLLAENTPQMEIHLDIEAGLRIDDVDVAEALIRCVQEAITNSLRHSGARQSWVRVWQEAGELNLEVRDDGRAGDITEGNGLTGMRERLASISGRLNLDNAGGALRLHAAIPMAA